MNRGHVPLRMCMGCGGRAPQTELVRVASTPNGGLGRAPSRHPAGRSGYLHRQPACWAHFAARKGPLRSLGRSVDKASRMVFVQELEATERSVKVR